MTTPADRYDLLLKFILDQRAVGSLAPEREDQLLDLASAMWDEMSDDDRDRANVKAATSATNPNPGGATT